MSSKTSEKSEDILVSSSSSSSSSDSDSHQQVDRCVSEAEKLWKEKKYDEALKEYERALTYARGDEVREGTICLGIGFAMLSLKDRKKSAIEYLNRSLEVAERQGQKGQVDFVSHLIRETRKNLEKDEDDMQKASKAAANAFAKTVGIDTSSSDGCCKDKKKENHYSEHISRVIVRVAEDTSNRGMVTAVKSTSSIDLKSTWSKWFHDEESKAYFVKLLSERLGGFELPSYSSLLNSCPNVGTLTKYIQENCPVQGDCSICPSKDTCSAHQDAIDIEDCTRESGCVSSTTTTSIKT